jgi:dihydropyrimidinase
LADAPCPKVACRWQYDLVIKGGQVATAEAVFTADIAIAGRQDRSRWERTSLGPRRSTPTGLIVTPGGVDPHCHIEQMSGMGQMNADTFETATRSAAMGGTTSVISFAAQAKGQRLADAAADYAARGARGAAIDYAFHLILADRRRPSSRPTSLR